MTADPGGLRRLILSSAGMLAVLATATSAHAEHPNALWRVVHDLCVRDKTITGLAAPCVKVDLEAGYAVVPDPGHVTQLLVTPTRHIVGIESAELQAADSPNYWAFAWAARKEFSDRAGVVVPPEVLGLAVNSATARTQDELHIHLDCLRPSVRDALDRQAAAITHTWKMLPLKLRGHRYNALWVDDLAARDPFKLLAQGPAGHTDMALQTLAAASVRRNGASGFVLLARSAHPEIHDRGAGEELLDHQCRLLDAAAGRKPHQ